MLSKRYSVFSSAFVLLPVLFLSLGSANQVSAAVTFDFNLPANGDVGAISFQLTFPDYPLPGLQIFFVGDPVVTSFSSGTPLDATISGIGFDVAATETLIGLAFFDPSQTVLFTVEYPGDFFVFSRTPTDPGLFGSLSGNVISDFTLATSTPTASLLVTESAIPEPATGAITGLALLGVASIFARKKGQARN